MLPLVVVLLPLVVVLLLNLLSSVRVLGVLDIVCLVGHTTSLRLVIVLFLVLPMVVYCATTFRGTSLCAVVLAVVGSSITMVLATVVRV